MEERKNKLACDDRIQNLGDYCLEKYKESKKKGVYKKETIPKFLKNARKEKNKK